MTEQERINVEVQTRLTVHDEKFNSLIQSLADFKDEMRDRDNQRHAEIAEIRASINAMGKHVRNMTIAAMVGVGAMALSVIFAVVFK